jgi:hypothetical protein
MDNTELEVEKIRQKMNRIKKNRKKKQNQACAYNYKNVVIVPTIYDIISSEKISDISNSNTIITPPPLPNLQNLLYNSNSYIPFNSVVEEQKPEKKEEEYNWIIKTFQYWFPKQEGLTTTEKPPPGNDVDLMNLKFWSLPCNFLSSKFYTNIFAVLIEKTSKYEDTTDDQNNKKNDISLIQSFFDQLLLIIVAYIMTINIYYFIFMYKWNCIHFAYVPKYGVYFGEYLHDILDFFLKDTRGPVFYCQYIYTSLYPTIFTLLEVRKYRRLCFVFIFLFMLCFVFITGAQIGLSAHSFIVDGKINPLVTLIVLMSVFYGIFFADETKTDAYLKDGIINSCTDSKAISTTLREFCNKENIEKVNARPFYYSLREKYEDFKKQIDKINKQISENPEVKKPYYIDELEKFINKYDENNLSLLNENTTAPVPVSTNNTVITGSPQIPSVPGLDPKQINFFATMAVAKGYTIIRAIMRLIIAMMCLPVAQIFVSWFFLYTTSGIGLLFEEGFGIFQTILCIKGHMNDNNGEDTDPDIGTNQFYKSVNENSFFKFWVNELLLTTMYSIYCTVKFLTVPTQLSKQNAQIIIAIIIAIVCGIIISRGYLLHKRHCNMNREECYYGKTEATKPTGIEKMYKTDNTSVTRYTNLANRTEKESSNVEAEFTNFDNFDNEGIHNYLKGTKYADKVPSTINFNELLRYVIVVLDKNNNRKLLFDLNDKFSEYAKELPQEVIPSAIVIPPELSSVVPSSITPHAIVEKQPSAPPVQIGGTNNNDIKTKIKDFIFKNLGFELQEDDSIYIYKEVGKPGRIGKIKIMIEDNSKDKPIIEYDNNFVNDGIVTKDNINALLYIYYKKAKPIITNLRRLHNVKNSIGKTLNKFNPINLRQSRENVKNVYSIAIGRVYNICNGIITEECKDIYVVDKIDNYLLCQNLNDMIYSYVNFNDYKFYETDKAIDINKLNAHLETIKNYKYEKFATHFSPDNIKKYLYFKINNNKNQNTIYLQYLKSKKDISFKVIENNNKKIMTLIDINNKKYDIYYATVTENIAVIPPKAVVVPVVNVVQPELIF